MKKIIDDHPQGQPLEFDIEIGDQVISYRLICPMCGATNFVISTDYELGGCSNEGCPCICFERLRDHVDMGGVGWVT